MKTKNCFRLSFTNAFKALYNSCVTCRFLNSSDVRSQRE